MADPLMIETLKEPFEALQPLMSARLRRDGAATEAQALGDGGMAAGTHATGRSRQTMARGLAELAAPQTLSRSSPTRSRRPGGGRPPGIETDPTVLQALETLVEPTTRGDPMSPRRWTGQSPRTLAEALQRPGHRVGARTVAHRRHAWDDRLQATRKTREGSTPPDRHAPCADMNAPGQAFHARGQPVGAIEAKKKARVGAWANQGQAWPPQGTPAEGGTHDVPAPPLGQALPYGVSDMPTNHGWVRGGMDHDTAPVATATWRRWGQAMGSPRSPQAETRLVTAESGGSHSRRRRLWTVALQAVADARGRPLAVGPFPPGTRTWQKMAHRMLCHITEHGRGRPRRRLEVLGNLMGHTTTTTGWQMQAARETPTSPTGLKGREKALAAVQRTQAPFHGAWHYTISPR